MRSMFSLDVLCKKVDAESGVPHITSAHSTRSYTKDVKKVMKVLLYRTVVAQAYWTKTTQSLCH